MGDSAACKVTESIVFWKATKNFHKAGTNISDGGDQNAKIVKRSIPMPRAWIQYLSYGYGTCTSERICDLWACLRLPLPASASACFLPLPAPSCPCLPACHCLPWAARGCPCLSPPS